MTVDTTQLDNEKDQQHISTRQDDSSNFTPEEWALDRSCVRKLDFTMLPLTALIYFFSFLEYVLSRISGTSCKICLVPSCSASSAPSREKPPRANFVCCRALFSVVPTCKSTACYHCYFFACLYSQRTLRESIHVESPATRDALRRDANGLLTCSSSSAGESKEPDVSGHSFCDLLTCSIHSARVAGLQADLGCVEVRLRRSSLCAH